MNRAVGNASFLLAVIAMALPIANIVRAGTPPLALVNPQWQPQTDSQGTSWMIDPQSSVRVNSGPVMLLNVINVPTINGQQFSPQRQQMTPDGREYVFEGASNNVNGFGGGPQPSGAVQVTRRIKIDLATSTLRFVETFQNSSAAPAQVNLSTNSSMRTLIRSVTGGPSGASFDATSGQRLAAGAVAPSRGAARGASVGLDLPPGDSGFAFSAQASNVAGAFLYLPGSKALKPAVEVQSARVLQLTLNVTVPARSTVSFVGGVSQLNAGIPSAQEMKVRLKIFQDRQWLADLPESVSKSIINVRHNASPTNLTMGPLLQPVEELASQFDVQRGDADILVQDEQLRLTGAVSGGSLSVDTALGKVSLPLADVALLYGGGGTDRTTRVYLRNGEILLGKLQGDDVTLKAQGGVDAKLPLSKVNMLFLHAKPGDGKAPAEACAIVQTYDGQRLLLSGSDARFPTATPWGTLNVDLGEIVSLASRREPQPYYRLTLRDGSDLSVVLQGAMPAVKTLRFGPVELEQLGLRQLSSLKMPPLKKSTTEDDDLPAGPAGPRCQLIGDNVLAGAIDLPRLQLATPSGTLELSTSGIRTAQRTGDAKDNGPFHMELANGREVTGTLANRTVPIRFHGTTWEIPPQHMMGFTLPTKTAATEDATEEGADNGKPPKKDERPSQEPRPPGGEGAISTPTLSPALPVGSPTPLPPGAVPPVSE